MNRKTLKIINNQKGGKYSWFYHILQIIIVLYTFFYLIKGNINNTLQCFFVFLFSLVPMIIEKKFFLNISEFLKFITLFFNFGAIILGNANNFYNLIPLWDIFLHTLSGFILAGFGFAICKHLNKNFIMRPFFFIFSLCFAISLGTCWEFFEFAADNVVSSDMQKDKYLNKISSTILNGRLSKKTLKTKEIAYTILYDKNNTEIIVLDEGYLDLGLIDTMEDLIVTVLGALAFCIISYIKIKNKHYQFIENFTIKKIAKHYT